MIEFDKELMNCLFYWYYVEKIGGEVNFVLFIFIIDLVFEDDFV